MNRLLLIAAGLLLAFILIQGCAQQDSDIYTISWYHFGNVPTGNEGEQFFGELNEYLAETIGVNINMIGSSGGDYNDRMQLVANSGEPWDLAFTASWAFSYRENALNGVFHPLDDLLEEYGQGITEALVPQFLEGNRINGELYAIPTNKEIGTWPVFVFSKKILDRYGWNPEDMNSYEKLEPYMAQFKKDYPNDYPLWPEPTDSAFLIFGKTSQLFFPLPFVQRTSGDTNTIINEFDLPEKVELYKLVRRYVEQGYVHPDLPTLASIGERVTNELRSGNFLAKFDRAFPGAESALEVRYGIPIEFVGLTDPLAENDSIAGSMLAISANSERPEKVMEFLNVLNTDPYVRNALNWGIEGVHYEKLGPNRIRRNLDANWPIPQFTLQNFYILWLTEDQPDDLWVKFKNFNDSAITSPSLGFHPDLSSIQGEINAITNTIAEYRELVFSNAPIDSALADMRAQLERDGFGRARDVLQRQYDAWRK